MLKAVYAQDQEAPTPLPALFFASSGAYA